MTLKQANSGTVYPEPQGGAVGPDLTPFNLELVGGALVVTPNGAVDARLLSDGAGHFVVTNGGDNPTSADEMRLMGVAGVITTYT